MWADFGTINEMFALDFNNNTVDMKLAADYYISNYL